MIKALLDTNVLLDFFNKRKSYEEAARILSFAAAKNFQAFVSAHEVTTLAYFLEKEERFPREFRDHLLTLLQLVHVLPVDKATLEDALHSRITDYEDAVLESVCRKHDIECIVTRNNKDFTLSRVKAYTPAQFLKMLPGSGPESESNLVREPAPTYHSRPRRRVKAK
jgi:predicted nucleic acid-binding protein